MAKFQTSATVNNTIGSNYKALSGKNEIDKSEEYEFLQEDQFYPNPFNENFSHTESDIEELKLAIMRSGLMHNLVATYDAEKKMYRIVSGETRWRAIQRIDEENKKRILPKGIITKVVKFTDESEERAAIIEANIIDRDYSAEDKARYIFMLLDNYREMKERNIISSIASQLEEKLGVKARMAKTWKKASESGDEIRERIEKGIINVTSIDKISRLDQEGQKELLEIADKNGKLTKEDIDEAILKQSIERQEKSKLEEDYKNEDLNISSANEELGKLALRMHEGEAVDDKIEELKRKIEKSEKTKEEITAKLENGVTSDEEENRMKVASAKAIKEIVDLTNRVEKVRKYVDHVSEKAKVAEQIKVMIREAEEILKLFEV